MVPRVLNQRSVSQGRYEEVKLPARFGGATMPDIAAIDMTHDQLRARPEVHESRSTRVHLVHHEEAAVGTMEARPEASNLGR